MEGTQYVTKEAVLRRAQEIKGIPLRDVDKTGRLATGKGAIGTVIEESWFGYTPNSDAEPDFPEAGVELNGSQVGQLVTLCRALEKLDPDALREKVQSVQETLRGLGAALEKAGGFFQRVMDAVNSVIDFFRGLFT